MENELEKENIDNKVIDDKTASEIKRKVIYSDEGDEALADFTYDAMLKEEEEEEEYFD